MRTAWKATPALLALTLAAACGDARVEIALTANKYLVLPFATAEVSAGALKVTATGLWPLGGGRRYLCWLQSTRSPATKLAGELKDGRLVASEAELSLKLSDYDRMLCTVESEPRPAGPSPLAVLKGETGGLLIFGSEALLATLASASASCRLDGPLAEWSYRGVPALPAGFRYALYLNGSFIDPNASTGVGVTHQHLSRSPAAASGAVTKKLLRLGWLGEADAGQGVYWEPGNRNLTGHRAALVSIEPAQSEGAATHFALEGPEGAAAAVSHGGSPAPPPAQQIGSLSVELEVAPQDIHVGDLVTFTFRISDGGAPVSGLTPEARYLDPSGGGGNISLAAGPEPGSYVGTKAFFNQGRHSIQISFTQSGQPVSASFEINVQQHQ